MPDINDPNLPPAWGAGSISQDAGPVDYGSGSDNQINMGEWDGADISSWLSIEPSMSGDVFSTSLFTGGTVDDVANQIGQSQTKTESGGFLEKITSRFNKAFDGKEGDKMIGMGVLAALNGIANHKYKEAQLKANQQVGAAAESRERRAAENAKSAGQAFGMIGKPQSGFKPISPVPRTGG